MDYADILALTVLFKITLIALVLWAILKWIAKPDQTYHNIARMEGFDAALKGKENSNPYLDSRLKAAYDNGYLAGNVRGK